MHVYEWSLSQLIYIASIAGLSSPHSLTTDDKGGLYIAEEGRDRISVYEKLPDFTGAFKLHRVLDAYQDIVSLAVTGNSTQRQLYVSLADERVKVLAIDKYSEVTYRDAFNALQTIEIGGAGGGLANPKTVALKGTGPIVWVANDNGIFAYEQLDDPALSTSRYYRLGIPTRFATKACNEAGKSIASCAGTYDNDNSLDLYGGYPMVRVTSVKVSGGTVQPGGGNWVNKYAVPAPLDSILFR